MGWVFNGVVCIEGVDDGWLVGYLNVNSGWKVFDGGWWVAGA